MPGAERRRAVLEAAVNDPASSRADVLRAAELLDRLDARPQIDPELAGMIEFWEGLRGMTPEQLDRELDALGAPNTTGPALLDDPHVRQRIDREAERRTRERLAEYLDTIRDLRAALRLAEARAELPTLPRRSQAASEAPSASQTAPDDDRPLRVVEIPPGIARSVATASKPKKDRVRTSFERKVRGDS